MFFILTVVVKPNKNMSEHEACAGGSSADKHYLFYGSQRVLIHNKEYCKTDFLNNS